eukprot:CAMPEP_0119383180 /NCGR_PEP_ID=MMETSP1334-20130426/77656_1 /TAXON_ID=127549 /ORGANISM="Calcidiscus leptoporus, Strain RCC1130" /LENGTH=54 /DNA_ID=CAMNT_0007403907 /DNA_START=81 /DNA_END=245 /DNA_ORIENTATION=+
MWAGAGEGLRLVCTGEVCDEVAFQENGSDVRASVVQAMHAKDWGTRGQWSSAGI